MACNIMDPVALVGMKTFIENRRAPWADPAAGRYISPWSPEINGPASPQVACDLRHPGLIKRIEEHKGERQDGEHRR